MLVVKGGGGKQGGGGGRDRKRREKAPYAFVESSRFSGATPAIMRFSTAPHRTNPGPLPSSLNHFLGVRAVCSCVRFVSRYPSPKQVARHDPALPEPKNILARPAPSATPGWPACWCTWTLCQLASWPFQQRPHGLADCKSGRSPSTCAQYV